MAMTMRSEALAVRTATGGARDGSGAPQTQVAKPITGSSTAAPVS